MDHGFPSSFDGLMALASRLRAPAGCPWDVQQTPRTLRRYLIEECYELVDAIGEGERAAINDELGDVLFNLAFQLVYARDEYSVPPEEVFGGVMDKMVHRHPHVFGDGEAETAAEVEARWVEQKRLEHGRVSVLDGIPTSMPSLLHARAAQERAASTGFDWDSPGALLEKIEEELVSLRSAHSVSRRVEELGDLMIAIVNLARLWVIDVDESLYFANERFRRRFSTMERLASERGSELADLSVDAKDCLWKESKLLEARSPAE